jgi:hypothetical protein
MSLLDAALGCVRRGWSVFPCGGKVPLFEGAYRDATLDEVQVREWWERTPKASPAIAPGKSAITVLDIDTGLTDEAGLRAFMRDRGIPETFAVRTGKRPQFRVQLYFQGCGGESFNKWQDGEFGGDLRATWGHVLAPGAVHPESKQLYAVLWDLPLAPVPAWVRSLKAQRVERIVDVHAPIVEWRNDTLFRVLCKHRANGADDEMIRDFALRKQAEMPNPLDEDELERIIQNACKFPIGSQDPVAVIIASKTAKPAPSDWREWFDAEDDILNAPPVRHVIRGVVILNRYNGIVALPGARKTILCWNVVRSCLTQKPLLDRFEVVNPPERVIFLAAESARDEIKKRLLDLDLVPFLKSGRLLIRSAANDSTFHQDALPESLVRGSLVIFDTFVRFFDGGDEQNALEARKFTEQMQRLVNLGATVLVMFHAPKGAKSDALDLQSIRGSGELGAGLAHGFALSMQGPTWSDNTLMRQVKNREHQCDPPVFEFSCDLETAVCTFVAEARVILGKRKTGPKKDDKTLAEDAAAEAFIQDNWTMPHTAIARALLETRGIKRDEKWVRRAKVRLGKSGAVHTEGAAASADSLCKE